MNNVQQITERVSFTHKGIHIYMALDYEQGTVSFVDKDGKPKKWYFNDRTVDYLGGWWLIFEALQEATKYADTRLREQAEARDKLKEQRFVNMLMSLADAAENRSGGADDNSM